MSATGFAFAKLLGYDIGTAAGLLAGAFSESTVIGTAGDAIQRLAMSDAEKTALLNNIPVAYAVTYLIGAAAVAWFLPTIGPKLMRINLQEEGARQQAEIAGSAELTSRSHNLLETFVTVAEHDKHFVRLPKSQQFLAAAALFKNFEQGFIASKISRRVGKGKLKIFHES